MLKRHVCMGDTSTVALNSTVPPGLRLRRTLSWVVVAALSVAALTAVGAILTGGFDETDGRIVATSLGFAVFSATGAAGTSLRLREGLLPRWLGTATVVLSGLSFVLLVSNLWTDAGEAAWRWWGSIAIAALASSHASLVWGGRRPTDSRSVRGLSAVSILLAAFEALSGILVVSGAIDDLDESHARIGAALLILLLLTTALPPILRRLQRPVGQRRRSSVVAWMSSDDDQASTPPSLAAELLAAADRLESLSAEPGTQAVAIRQECERLRRLARSHFH